MSYLRLLWKNLVRRKLRTGLTVFAIFSAFLIFGMLGALQNSLNAGVQFSGANRLVTVNKISFVQALPISYDNRIKAVKGVSEVTYAAWFGAYYQDPRKLFAGFAVEPESYLAVYPELVVPDDQRASWLKDRRGALVGRNLARRFGWTVGQTVPISSNIWSQKDGSQTWEFTIDGIFTAKDKQIDTSYMLFHYDYLNEARTFGRDGIGWLVLTVDKPELNESVAKTIDATFANSPAETKTSTEKAFNKAFLEQFGNIGFVVTSVVSAAFFTILLIAGNTMMLALRERTPEIAVMKVLGFSSPTILLLVLAESVLLVLIGGLPGLAAAWAMIIAVKAALAGILGSIALTPEIAIEAVAIMIVMGLATGALPAWNAMRLNVASALARR